MFFSQTDNVSQLAYLDDWLKSQLEPYEIEKSQIKNFKKSYYEIRYNLKATGYIPNFDKYDLIQKRNTIVLLSKRTPEEVDVMDVAVIEQEFNRLIGKEISELERDLVEAFS